MERWRKVCIEAELPTTVCDVVWVAQSVRGLHVPGQLTARGVLVSVEDIIAEVSVRYPSAEAELVDALQRFTTETGCSSIPFGPGQFRILPNSG